MRPLALALLLAVAASSVASAQPARPQTAGPAPAAGAMTKRERIKKRIQALRAYMLIDELGVDDQQSAKLLGVFSRYDDDFEKLLTARADLMRRLAAVTEKDAKADSDKLIDDMIANERAVRDVETRRLADLRKMLTPAQTAHLIVALPQLERKIQNQLRRAIMAGGGGAAAAGAAAPRPKKAREAGRPDFGEDDDDDDTPAAPPGKRR